MGRVSMRPVDPEVRKELFDVLLQAFSKAVNEKERGKLMNDLLTPSEKIMLGKRLMTAVLLERGYTYVQISELLKLSSATIYGIRRELDKGGEGYRSIVYLFDAKKAKLDEMFKKVDSVLRALTLPVKGSRSSMRRWKNS